MADDLLQDLFLKALRQGDRFCDLHNARAWLFEVARNLLADQIRVAHHRVALPEPECGQVPTATRAPAFTRSLLAFEQIQPIATRDELTGTANHRHMLEKMRDETQRANRTASLLLFAILDIDHFKKINDAYGHHAGDLAL